MEPKNKEKNFKNRLRSGDIRQRDVVRRLAELAFGRANDCMKLIFHQEPGLDKLDLSLLSEIKRSEKGTVEVKLVDRLKALELLAQAAQAENTDLESFLKALQLPGEEGT